MVFAGVFFVFFGFLGCFLWCFFLFLCVVFGLLLLFFVGFLKSCWLFFVVFGLFGCWIGCFCSFVSNPSASKMLALIYSMT